MLFLFPYTKQETLAPHSYLNEIKIISFGVRAHIHYSMVEYHGMGADAVKIIFLVFDIFCFFFSIFNLILKMGTQCEFKIEIEH